MFVNNCIVALAKFWSVSHEGVDRAPPAATATAVRQPVAASS
jgi:hypothetical protein